MHAKDISGCVFQSLDLREAYMSMPFVRVYTDATTECAVGLVGPFQSSFVWPFSMRPLGEGSDSSSTSDDESLPDLEPMSESDDGESDDDESGDDEPPAMLCLRGVWTSEYAFRPRRH